MDLKNIIKDVLDRYADIQLNLGSEVCRVQLAEEISRDIQRVTLDEVSRYLRDE